MFGGSVVGPRDQVNQAIIAHLTEELDTNPAEASALMLIRGLEYSKSPVIPGVPITERPTDSEWREKQKQNISKILSNLIQSPNNAKYRRLRSRNRMIQDLLSVDGMEAFLHVGYCIVSFLKRRFENEIGQYVLCVFSSIRNQYFPELAHPFVRRWF